MKLRNIAALVALFVAPLCAQQSPWAVPLFNDASTGTTQFYSVCTTSTGTAIICPTTATVGSVGLAAQGAGVTGQVLVQKMGPSTMQSDGATTAGHFIQLSGSTAGKGHDAGGTCPTSGQTFGYWTQAVGSALPASMVIDLTLCPSATASASGTVNTATINQTGCYAAAGATISGCGPGTAGQIYKSAGAGSPSLFVDLTEPKVIPAANCNNTTAGPGWSIGAGGTVTCRAGTNNLGGYISITGTSSTFAQFSIPIPMDWDTGTLPYIRFYLSSTDTTNGHTIIPQIKVACQKGDGTTTDDVSFNAAHSSSTVTLNTTSSQFWSTSNVQMNSTDMTGCVGGSMMTVQVGRAADTGTTGNFYAASITFPRLIVLQAN